MDVNTKSYLSVVCPIYNEEETLHQLVSRVSNLKGKFENFELILINDGSTDATKSIIDGICEQNAWVKKVQLSRNFGHQVAVMAGLRNCKGEIVAIIDGDLQDPPELIVAMAGQLKLGYDIVYGERISRDGENIFKLLTARMFYFLLNKVSDIYIPPNVGDFRVVSRRAAQAVAKFEEPFPFIRGLFAYTGYPSKAFPYRREKRFAGRTKYPIKSMFRLAGHALFSFSETPIRIAFRASALLTLFSFLGVIGSLVNLVKHGGVPGWLSLIAIICLLGAINIFFLAISLKYSALTLSSVRKRPLFFTN